jgi:YidC/Oxa1 family membrane protein insertase
MYTWFDSISSLLHPLLTALFGLTHDWGLAVIGLTLGVKIGLFYFNLLAAKQQVRSAGIQPKLKELREKHTALPEKFTVEMMKLYRENGIRPFRGMMGMLVQMPILLGMYGLFLTHGSVMTSMLIPWVSNLAQSDSLHLIPVLTAVISCITGLIPLTTAGIPVSGTNKLLTAALMLIIPLTFMWRSPAALGLYWMTSTGFGLLERGFYRTRWGKRLLS